MTDDEMPGRHDFDVLPGSWRIHNRRLVSPLSGSDEWYEFEATMWARAMLGGAANIDEYRAPALGLTGMTVRTFDPESGDWSIYWSSTTALGPLQPPVVGRFVDGVGRFYCDDDYKGVPIKVRYIWSEMTDVSLRWEQSFSTDGGSTWEVNWIMVSARVTDDDPAADGGGTRPG